MNKYYNPFKGKTVKEDGEYVLGMYVNRIPIYGLYLETEEEFIKELEIKAKAKFKLENDAENYVQNLRMYYFIVLDKYIEKFGFPTTDKDKRNMEKYISKGCLNKLKDLSRTMKSKISYYDEELQQVIIHNLLSLDKIKESYKDTFYFDSIEYEIYSKERMANYNAFNEWLNENKHEILTKKQIQYLSDGSVVSDKNKRTIERNILKRLDREYSNLSIEQCKEMVYKNKIKILEEILFSFNNEDFYKNIIKYLDEEDWLLEVLYSMDIEYCKIITNATKGIYNNDTKNTYMISKKILEIIKQYEEKCLILEKNKENKH